MTFGWMAVPLLYAMAAVLVGSRLLTRAQAFRVGGWVSAANVGLAVVQGLAAKRSDAPAVVVLILVTAVAAVILRFSRRYLDGERGQRSFVRWFLATVSAATLLLGSRHLLVLALAWTATSIALHQLLVFYDDRPEAQAVAHKKFLASRMADLALYAAVAILWERFGTADIDALAARLATLGRVPASVQVSGVLLVAAVALRSAQLPFHGWLIQVMEAPTPVSALLHAGVVNIGGFVVIRLAGVLDHLGAARGVLVCVGTFTALVAGLVMTTRISVKVALAWSTCAQMGFMLLECGLGAYSLALLHLVAHSLYKAHAFLASGRAVEAHRGAPAKVPSVAAQALGLLLSATVLGVLYIVATRATATSLLAAGVLVPGSLVALALAPLHARTLTRGALSVRAATSATAVILAATYLATHALFGGLVSDGSAPPVALRAFVVAAFFGAWALQVVVARRKDGRVARWLYPAAYAGFYLDDVATRVAFRIAPPPSSAEASASHRALLLEGRAS